jgi:hypothetical protein
VLGGTPTSFSSKAPWLKVRWIREKHRFENEGRTTAERPLLSGIFMPNEGMTNVSSLDLQRELQQFAETID